MQTKDRIVKLSEVLTIGDLLENMSYKGQMAIHSAIKTAKKHSRDYIVLRNQVSKERSFYYFYQKKSKGAIHFIKKD